MSIFLCIHGLQVRAEDYPLNKILDAMSKDKGDLSGCQITASCTVTVLGLKTGILGLLSTKKNLDEKAIEGLKGMASQVPDADTNKFAYVYKFGSSGTEVSVIQFNSSGQLKVQNEAIITTNEVWQYAKTPAGNDKKRPVSAGWATIKNRDSNGLYGIPVYLGIATIYEKIINSAVRGCTIEKSKAGKDCYAVSLPGAPGTSFEKFKILFETNGLSPVEFESYYADGALASQTELFFDKSGTVPRLCRKAITHGHTMGSVITQSVWQLDSIKRMETNEIASVDHLIPKGIRVIDERSSTRDLFYHIGFRPPTLNEIAAMSTNKLGVARYEAATLNHSRGETVYSKRDQFLVRIVLTMLFVAPIVAFLLTWKKLIWKKH